MADIHKYKFIFSGSQYNDGWERIFGKRGQNAKKINGKAKVYNKNRNASRSKRTGKGGKSR